MELPRRLGATCGIAGPAVFTTGWLVFGALTPGYSPLEDAISRLAAEGARTRTGMTLCLVAFGVLLPVWAPTLARHLGVAALRPVVTLAGLTTLAVAALPLTHGGGTAQDTAHALAAVAVYVAMALTPVVAARGLSGRARAASLAVGAVSALGLGASVATGSGGLQRLGLTAVDAWHVAVAVDVLRRSRP